MTDKNQLRISSMRLGSMTTIIIFALTMMSCASGRHASAVEQGTHTDTVYIATQQYDSIYIYNDKTLDRTKDTVYLRELSTEYRYKLLRDTLRIIETDTIYIPYGVKVADNGKDKSFLPRFSELSKAAFLVVTAALALWVALRNKA